jgi:enamine deaminase RidA (YjgF/YER057c/UK114 family)
LLRRYAPRNDNERHCEGQRPEANQNIAVALAQAGCTLEDVVRVNYVLPDGRDFEACWPVLRKYLGKAKPAAMVITAGLLDPRMKIEIEVTALKATA